MIVSFGSKETERIWNGIRVKKFRLKFRTWTSKIENDAQLTGR